MDTLVSIAIAALCVSGAIFFIAAIGFLRRSEQRFAEVSKSIETVAADVSSFNEHLTPVLDNLTAATDNIRTISENINTQIEAVKNVVAIVNHFASDLRHFEKEFKNRVEIPVLDGAQYVGAIAKGIRTFLRVMKS